MTGLLIEARALTMRWFWHLKREPYNIFFTLTQPMIWLLLFGNLFERAREMPGFPSGTDYLTFMTAGVVVMTVLGNGMAGGIPLLFDRENGFLEKVLATPANRGSILLGRIFYIVAMTLAQTLLMLAVAYLMGVRVRAGLPGVGMILLISLLFTIGLAVVSLTLAFSLREHGSFFAIIGVLSLPLFFLSSALIPLNLVPNWMRAAAMLNPMTHAIDASRSLILSGWDWRLLGRAFGYIAAFDLAMFALCYRRLTRPLL
jgi:ABC-2 type transport system permease protein